jgi:indole-3-glycerol phosphate synthase
VRQVSGDLLTAVVAASRRSAEERERQVARDVLEATLAFGRPAAGTRFRQSLQTAGVRLIAECKRRSPSRGVLRREYDPAGIARAYEQHGAAAISILTEPTFFDGSLDHLRQVRAAVDLPLLRKDFIVTDYQVIEAAAAGADAVLLIVAALDDGALKRLLARAAGCGLATLTEVHDAGELARAIDAGADIIGVNSRNLRTLQVDVSLLEDLGPRIPAGVVAVAESGLRTAADVARLRDIRYDAFLIGERFMTEPAPGEALDALRRGAEAMRTS